MDRNSLIATGIVTLGIFTAAVIIAGPLDPPAGPVASTHKTLTEVEPRIAINGANTPGDNDSLFKITQPGSYYLTQNITGSINKHGIEVASGGVTIDLNGFELVGVRGTITTHGIVSTGTGLRRIIVRDGVIREWGGHGISLSQTIASGGEITNVYASDNVGSGIFVHSYFRVIGCVATANGETGIWAVNSSLIDGCLAFSNGGDGIQCGSGHTVTNCVSYGNSGAGVRCSDAATITGCSSYNNDGAGIAVGVGSTVTGCTARSNDSDGIFAAGQSAITSNTCSNNGPLTADGAGIHVIGNGCRVEANHCDSNDRGVDVDSSRNRIDGNSCVSNGVSFDIAGSDNLVIRNTAVGGSPNYLIGAGNSVAPRVSVTDSDGWAGITNANHPWANLGH